MTEKRPLTSRPTLADIARLAEVSEATASRAMRDHPQIRERTRKLVQQVARELGYVPNAAARSLVRQASRTLGLIVPDVTDPVHGLIIAGFGQVADARGYTVIVLDGARDELRRERGLRALLEHQPQGIAFCSALVAPAATRAAIRAAHTVFIMPEGPDDLSGGSDLGRIEADDAQGIGLLVDHLLEQGHRRFSWVGGPDIASNRRRRREMIRTLEAHGIEPRIREYVANLDDADLDRTAVLVERERPDVLVCYDDKLALHLMGALRRRGLRVPDDVAVTGFDGIPFASIANPTLTTVVQPASQLGERAAEALLDAVASGRPPADITLPVTLAIGESSRRLA